MNKLTLKDGKGITGFQNIVHEKIGQAISLIKGMKTQQLSLIIDSISDTDQPLNILQKYETLNQIIFGRLQFKQQLALLSKQPDFLIAATVTQPKVANIILSQSTETNLIAILSIKKTGHPNNFIRLLNTRFKIDQMDTILNNTILRCESNRLVTLLTDNRSNQPHPLIKSIVFKQKETLLILSKLDIHQTLQVLDPLNTGQPGPLQQADISLKSEGATEPIWLWTIEKNHPLADLLIFDPINKPLLSDKMVADWLKGKPALKTKIQPLIQEQIKQIEDQYKGSVITRIFNGVSGQTSSKLNTLYSLRESQQPKVSKLLAHENHLHNNLENQAPNNPNPSKPVHHDPDAPSSHTTVKDNDTACPSPSNPPKPS